MPQSVYSVCDQFTWIDVVNPSEAEVLELSKQHQLNPHIVQDSLQPEHLPKYEMVEDGHFMIIRYHSQKDNPATIQELTDKVAILYTDQLLLTIHMAQLPFLQAIYQRLIRVKKDYTTTEVVAKIVWNALETFDDRANALSSEVDVYEEQIMRRKSDNLQMEGLYLIKREAALALKVLLLMQEPVNHIIPKAGEESMIQDLKDQHLKMRTLYSQVADETNNLMNLYMSFSSQKTNDVVKVLTIFSVFFMPLTFIVGIYGMNFEFMPELQKRWGYPGVLILMVLITVAIYIWFKRKRWL